MEARAKAKYIREAPRKTRLVIDLIRGKNAAEAAVILQFTPREAARTVLKVLNSAVANAVNKGASGAEGLTVSEAFVDEGPTLKRFRPRAQGRASRINKRSSHITIVVSGEDVKPKATRKTAKATEAKPAAKSKTATGEIASSPKTKAPRLPADKAGNDRTTRSKAKTDKPAAKPAPKKEAAKKAPVKEEKSGSEG